MKKPPKFPQWDNPKARARELAEAWEQLVKRHSKPLFSSKPKPKPKPKKVQATKVQPKVSDQVKPSDPKAMFGSTSATEPKVYTGDKIIGIATMHKSNLVPIFTEQEAIDVSQMRRN